MLYIPPIAVGGEGENKVIAIRAVLIPRGSAASSSGGGCLERAAGRWCTVRALESGSVILEMKDGACKPIGEEDIMGR